MDEITIDGKHYVTLQKASEGTDYDREYLRKLAKAKKINAVQIGSVWMVNIDSITLYRDAKPQRGSYIGKNKTTG
jgi:hypothetical protein